MYTYIVHIIHTCIHWVLYAYVKRCSCSLDETNSEKKMKDESKKKDTMYIILYNVTLKRMRNKTQKKQAYRHTHTHTHASYQQYRTGDKEVTRLQTPKHCAHRHTQTLEYVQHVHLHRPCTAFCLLSFISIASKMSVQLKYQDYLLRFWLANSLHQTFLLAALNEWTGPRIRRCPEFHGCVNVLF